MAKYARIQDGIVAELFTPPPGVPITACFVPSLVWVDVTAQPSVAPGWTYSGTTFAAPVAPPPTPDQVCAAKIAAGITITGNAALAGVYALDDVSAGQIFQIGLYAKQFGTFPSGDASLPYPDMSGTPHTFAVAQFVAFLQAVAPLVSALETQQGVMQHGGQPSWPAQTAAIA